MNWQMLGMATGLVLLGASGLRAVGAVFGSSRRARDTRQQLNDRHQKFAKQLTAALKWVRASKPVYKAWSGTRPFRISGVVEESQRCKSFYLVPADGRPLPRFEPGQYLTFNLPVDPRLRPIVRCYSLSERPREDYYRVTIKQLVVAGKKADVLVGQGSSYFHQHVKVGTRLDIQAPQGAFFLDPTNEQPIVLIGAGIGITPIMSMVNSILHDRSVRDVYLFAGFGNSGEQPFREHLQELAQQDRIDIDISYSRPMPADKLGRDYQHRGRVDIARLRDKLPSNNFCFYVCGPADMMESLVPALRDWGVPDTQIRYEAFGPASVKSLSSRVSADIAAKSCEVSFSQSESTCHWNGKCKSLLEFAESEGVTLDSGCRAGSCGQCLTKIQQGKVAHLKQAGVPLAENECLTCISVPQGDVVLEA